MIWQTKVRLLQISGVVLLSGTVAVDWAGPNVEVKLVGNRPPFDEPREFFVEIKNLDEKEYRFDVWVKAHSFHCDDSQAACTGERTDVQDVGPGVCMAVANGNTPGCSGESSQDSRCFPLQGGEDGCENDPDCGTPTCPRPCFCVAFDAALVAITHEKNSGQWEILDPPLVVCAKSLGTLLPDCPEASCCSSGSSCPISPCE